MQLLATTYQNIGPFLNRTLTVAFHKGKYMIKAPIGSGKSFMFFDGPVFGLYKYGARTMLSMKAEEGYIKALFEVGGNYYLVIRTLSRTKSGGDGVKSKLFTIQSKEQRAESKDDMTYDLGLNLLKDVVNEGIDIETILREQGAELEEVIFKNETDLQQNLADFLPPREVFTSTTFLMQDSENMFEMTPADRINVFKNIFGLLDIDEAKEVIAEAKKDVVATIKSRKNTDDVNAKLQRLLGDYLNIITNNKDSRSDDILSHAEDRSMVQDKLSIENFDLASLPLDAWNKLAETYDKQRSQYQSLLGQFQEKQKQHQNLSTEKENEIEKKRKLLNQKEILESKINTDNSEIIKKLHEDKGNIMADQGNIIAILPFTQTNTNSVHELAIYINNLEQTARLAKNNKNQLEQRLKDSNLLLEKIEADKTNIAQEKAILEQDQTKREYFCNRIKENCPFIEEIGEKIFNQNINARKALLEKKEANLDKSSAEADRNKIIDELKNVNTELDTALKEHMDNKFNDRKKDIDTYLRLEIERQKIDKDLIEYEKEKELHEGYKNELIHIQSQLQHIEERIKTLIQDLINLDEEISLSKKDIDSDKLDRIEYTLSSIAKAIKILETISDLVATHKNNMLMIKQLEEREAMLGQLYTIFSKEIMIHVLQQTLPLFADVLNNLLAKVVDYSVSFETKNTGDKLELEIKVHDSKGERLVKSLSGGQKTVLRLSRTFAICIFTRSNALFLDETVNNIDKETIGKVADLIDDFTKTHDITFYIITHSEAIQEMEIWDKVISL